MRNQTPLKAQMSGVAHERKISVIKQFDFLSVYIFVLRQILKGIDVNECTAQIHPNIKCYRSWSGSQNDLLWNRILLLYKFVPKLHFEPFGQPAYCKGRDFGRPMKSIP